jgi:VanZ family protein
MTRWVPVVVWMIFILVASTDLGSAGTTFHFLKPILRWLDPTISEDRIYHLNILARKTMHLIEFATLAILVWRTRMAPGIPRRRNAPACAVGLALAVCAFFAVSTEIVQFTMRSRAASVRDVWINMGGAVLGLLLIALVKTLRRARQAKNPLP